jgi:hypothetical protein
MIQGDLHQGQAGRARYQGTGNNGNLVTANGKARVAKENLKGKYMRQVIYNEIMHDPILMSDWHVSSPLPFPPRQRPFLQDC